METISQKLVIEKDKKFIEKTIQPDTLVVRVSQDELLARKTNLESQLQEVNESKIYQNPIRKNGR